MAFELKHGEICGNGAITEAVSMGDTVAFSARANDVFNNLQLSQKTNITSKSLIVSSSDEEEDLLPLCGAKASKPMENSVLHVHRRHMNTGDSKTQNRCRAASEKRKRRDRKVRFAVEKSTSDEGDATQIIDDDSPRQTGVVTRWDNGRGFGFIKPLDGGKDVFCHVTVIQDGNSLLEGSTVSYSAIYDDRRRKYRAEKVTGGVTIDRMRPREVIEALEDETLFTRYSLEDIDVSNSSNTKVAVSFLNSKKPNPVGERHVCKVGSVKFKPQQKRTHMPAKTTESAAAAMAGPRLSHLNTLTFDADKVTGVGDGRTDSSTAVPAPQPALTQFKKKKKKRKTKVRRRTRPT